MCNFIKKNNGKEKTAERILLRTAEQIIKHERTVPIDKKR